ncbi:MAG: hypothetical protein M1827_000077 [Pycnora praestabilis]|nr:MAG: hypothetical protein M1827_000077 [Pycnora praestabilis]
MDMLEEDLAIRDEFETKKCGDDSSEATFHFVAFVPYQDMVWKLDGLERDAQCLGGSRSSEWLNLARPFIEAMIAERGGVDLHFALLALVGDPLGSFVSVLAENVKALQKLRTRLNAVEPDWRSFSVYDDVDDGGGVILGPDMVYGLDDESISQATLSPFYEEKLRANTASSLMGFRQELITAQASLRRSFQEEHQNVQSEEVRAATRRHDFGPMILEWLQMLCKKGQLKSLIERAEDNFMNYQR